MVVFMMFSFAVNEKDECDSADYAREYPIIGIGC